MLSINRKFLSFLVVGALFLSPVLVYAQTTGGDSGLVKCGPQQDKLCELKDLFDLLVGIYNFLLGTAGIVAFGLLIWGGIQMILFSVDEEKMKSGKATVMQALIGLSIILLAYIIVNTLLMAIGVTSGASQYFNGSFFGG